MLHICQMVPAEAEAWAHKRPEFPLGALPGTVQNSSQVLTLQPGICGGQ